MRGRRLQLRVGAALALLLEQIDRVLMCFHPDLLYVSLIEFAALERLQFADQC